jgi:hypothetical protein
MGLSNTEKKVYLTFDDGLHRNYRMGSGTTGTTQRQSYFCIERISKHTPIFEKLTQRKFRYNHTFNHLNGWKNYRRRLHKYFL